jgi:cell division protein FtsW
MLPRVVLYLSVFALVALGLLMIYSASSVMAAADPDCNYNAAYYLIRQGIFAAVGLGAAAVMSVIDYHVFADYLLPIIWAITVALLMLVIISSVGAGAYGAVRWLDLGFFSLQPSEFAKLTVILTAANVCKRYFEDGALSFGAFATIMAVAVGVPLFLIVVQPDKGTTIICAVTLVVMAYLDGFPSRPILVLLGCVIVLALILAFKDEYSRERVFTMLDPFQDPLDKGYQIIQGFYAFGTGGLFGVGVGLSRQKYSYLPMAHNDFIFAVIGEELGLAGTLGTLLGFFAFLWAGYQIARYAPDLTGRLVAAGCTSLLVIQLLVNVGGVLSLIPLTGKPIPFLSYGGSSIISSLMLVGMVSSISLHSSLPVTEYDERRQDWGLTSEPAHHYRSEPSLSLVGEPTPRSQRQAGAATQTPPFSVVGGGRAPSSTPLAGTRRVTSPESLRAEREFSEAHAGGRVSVDGRGRRRIDLGPSASERLRPTR